MCYNVTYQKEKRRCEAFGREENAMHYDKLSEELVQRIKEDRKNNVENPYASKNGDVIRRKPDWDRENLWRPSFVRDIEKIIHSPYYNRYTDKTQVFSFYKNDDITRRALHVQLVSRIARNIGSVLGLNNDLIEAIALGHDIGHTPFGHAGERILNKIYHERTGRYFNHNVHSVRVLDNLFERNISLQTLDGIVCHNGEFEMQEYRPKGIMTFEDYDKMVEVCYTDKTAVNRLIPMTLEGCVVRICDMIAYLGKDRQDARKANLIDSTVEFKDNGIGVENADMTNNLVVNIIENSYGKDYIYMDEQYYDAIKIAKRENSEKIYMNEKHEKQYRECIEPMFYEVYERLIGDLETENKTSVIYSHHIDFVNIQRGYYKDSRDYALENHDDIVVDYIASMTDDYFIDLYEYMFPKGKNHIEYIPYF